MKTFDLSFISKIEMEEKHKNSTDLPLPVHGLSVRAGYIKNKQFIIREQELPNIAKTLREGVDGTGAYILKDHGYQGGGFFQAAPNVCQASSTNGFLNLPRLCIL